MVNNPNYNFTDKSLKLGMDVSSTDRSSSSGFKSSKTGFQLGTGFEQYEDLFFTPEITVAFEDIEVDVSIYSN